MSIDINKAIDSFNDVFGTTPQVAARAPGRVNIIGEHTDYNDGFVLPMAIEYDTVIVGLPRKDRTIRMYASNLDRNAEADLDKRVRNPEDPWTDYIVGVVDELFKLDKTVHGADLLVMGDVPIGCGLSSSAALEMAALVFFEALGNFKFADKDAALLGQRVENNFLGLSTGIMDQFISRSAQKDHALFLDCRSYAGENVPIAFDEFVFVVANTACARGLTASKYNERVEECKEAVHKLQLLLNKSGEKLRDYTHDELLSIRDQLQDIPFRRAQHVITENDRCLKAREAMRAGDVQALGTLLNASHESLRVDYEVTSTELDTLSAIGRSLPGCLGARMTGAGFGGCTVNLVRKDAVDRFCEDLMRQYGEETGISGEVYVSKPAEGAGLIQLG
ncbi:MAG: galactokinase [Candidatus Hydrogenedentes bacterium]|nr:galactokinase [Candidatus Hydrogenedentota bacterium]